MARGKMVEVTLSVKDAVSNAYSDLNSLADECREVVDNASEGLSQTQRIQTLDETASALENHADEPEEVPDVLANATVTFMELRSKRGLSRASRRDNAVAVLEACIDVIDNVGAEGDDDLDEFRQELEETKDDAEGCEFPGMYG